MRILRQSDIFCLLSTQLGRKSKQKKTKFPMQPWPQQNGLSAKVPCSGPGRAYMSRLARHCPSSDQHGINTGHPEQLVTASLQGSLSMDWLKDRNTGKDIVSQVFFICCSHQVVFHIIVFLSNLARDSASKVFPYGFPYGKTLQSMAFSIQLQLSFRYLWIIHGSPPSQPGGARLLLGDGTQFIKTCRASITSLTRRKRDETSAVSSTSVFALRPWIQMEVSRSGASLIAGWFLMENP